MCTFVYFGHLSYWGLCSFGMCLDVIGGRDFEMCHGFSMDSWSVWQQSPGDVVLHPRNSQTLINFLFLGSLYMMHSQSTCDSIPIQNWNRQSCWMYTTLGELHSHSRCRVCFFRLGYAMWLITLKSECSVTLLQFRPDFSDRWRWVESAESLAIHLKVVACITPSNTLWSGTSCASAFPNYVSLDNVSFKITVHVYKIIFMCGQNCHRNLIRW